MTVTKNKIRAVLFDIDGVITDGKKYTDGISKEIKSVSYKDLDAIKSLQDDGILVGCISGEDTPFSRNLAESLDFYSLGEKNKKKVLEHFERKYRIEREQICYTGDGKYDIGALEYAGLSVCPKDAVYEVKLIVDLILDTAGGQGCIAELYTKLSKINDKERELENNMKVSDIVRNRINTHCHVSGQILEDESLLGVISEVCGEIISSYKRGGQLLLCGNGGSAADAQHLAAELVGRFYLERKAYAAEALSVNTSVLTSLANDYDYNMIFARQVEAKGRAGDVLIGITTSGKSENIVRAFRQAKSDGLITVLMTGNISGRLPVLEDTDYVVAVPSDDTPRIQECHILIGHIICEIIESKLTEESRNE